MMFGHRNIDWTRAVESVVLGVFDRNGVRVSGTTGWEGAPDYGQYFPMRIRLTLTVSAPEPDEDVDGGLGDAAADATVPADAAAGPDATADAMAGDAVGDDGAMGADDEEPDVPAPDAAAVPDAAGGPTPAAAPGFGCRVPSNLSAPAAGGWAGALAVLGLALAIRRRRGKHRRDADCY